MALALATPAFAQAGESCAADPEAAARSYDYVLGAQAIGGSYRFEKGSALLEQARTLEALGSNILKISLAKGAAPNYGTAAAAAKAKTTLEYIEASPDLQQALDMDFAYTQAWVHSFTDSKWRDGITMTEARQYYDEMYALTAWLLQRYSGTGRVFMLGNWEGDWQLLGRQDRDALPSRTAIDGMVALLKIRQLAIDNAKAAVPHEKVDVFHYVELNLARKGMEGKPSVASSVLPQVDVDLVSYSAYEAIKQSQRPDLELIRQPLTQVLAYLEGQLKPKPDLPFARRVFIGEYGFHADRKKPLTVKQQYMKSRFVMQVAIEQDLPFALIWQLYNNEYAEDGTSREMSLVDESGRKRALYVLHRDYLRAMRDFVVESCRETGAEPTRAAFKDRALTFLKAAGYEKMQALADAEAD
ncbi:MAG: hypothetical protein GC147_08865 [Porphyrobacter sp.]|nr:hypothetical protein [Porphyrobacter sp.]